MMKPKVLKTEADYEAALAHLETLMDAKPGSPEEDELEVFAVLIEDYEAAHGPTGSAPEGYDPVYGESKQGLRGAKPQAPVESLDDPRPA
jgi:antitoxin component HigA of HigAB toxin-antitoxin module